MVPTGGGIGFVIVGIVGMALYGNYSALLCLPLAIVGFWDISLNPIFRYFIQLLTVSLLFSLVQWDSIVWKYKFIFVYSDLLMLFNCGDRLLAINFMDGLDGLVDQVWQ